MKKTVLLLFVLLGLLIPRAALGQSPYFFDNFRVGTTVWTYKPSSVFMEEPKFTDSGLVIYSDKVYLPFVYNSKNVVLPVGKDYNLKVRFRYTRVSNVGSGMGIGFINASGNYLPQSVVWQDGGILHFFHQDFSERSSCTNISAQINMTNNRTYHFFDNLTYPDMLWHTMEIDRQSGQFKMFLDREQNPDPFITTNPSRVQCQPNIIFFGNQVGSNGGWSSFLVDYVEVKLINQSSPTPTPSPSPTETPVPTSTPTPVPTETPTPTFTPTPTPTSTPTPSDTPTPTLMPTIIPTDTPTPTFTPTQTPTLIPTPTVVPKTKVIIVPGFGASWNTGAIVYNWPVSDNDWKMTPVVHEYDGLAATLQAKGYSLGTDLLVWNYDWRRPLQEIVPKLNVFISSHVGENERVVLVGHSEGGLVSRLWAKQNSTNPRLKKVITLGSPHLGLADAYEVWAGARLSKTIEVTPESIGKQILLSVWRRQYGSDKETIRRVMPILKDFIGTYPLLKKNGIFLETNAYQNIALINLNQGPEVLTGRFKAVVGVGQNTYDRLVLSKQKTIDKILGLWEDGSLISRLYSNGDNTVANYSAKVISLPFEEVQSKHRTIPDASINMILQELGLPLGGVIASKGVDLSGKIIFFIGSPASLKVDCGNGSAVSDGLGFVVVGVANKCRVEVVGSGNGIFHLYAVDGRKPNNWHYFEDSIASGVTKKFVYDFLHLNPVLVKESGSQDAWVLLKGLVDKLDVPKCKSLCKGMRMAIDEKDLDKFTRWLFMYRRAFEEQTISNEALKLIVQLYSLEKVKPKNSFEMMHELGDGHDERDKHDERDREMTFFGASSAKLAEEYSEQAKVAYGVGDWGYVRGVYEIDKYLTKEIWARD